MSITDLLYAYDAGGLLAFSALKELAAGQAEPSDMTKEPTDFASLYSEVFSSILKKKLVVGDLLNGTELRTRFFPKV